MAETSQRLTTIEAIERQREDIGQKLREVKAELDDLDTKKRGADAELSRMKEKGFWGWLFTSYR
jgi:predicted  nucleic acid-binding Zn-ribbon protein